MSTRCFPCVFAFFSTPQEIGIGGSLAAPALPHHRAYGSVPRRFGWLNVGVRFQEQG